MATRNKRAAGKPPKPTSPITAAKPVRQSKPLRKKAGFFPIVGIGASAGGLEALEGFFSNMPEDCGLAFVVIQHLAPNYKSIVGTILEKYTKLNILEIKDGMKVRPNQVYLNPSDMEVAVINGTLRLIKPSETHAVRLPIDYFFRSLAADRNELAVCVVLSGTGTDGTMGLKAIKGAGGIVLVQEEKQAKYSGMPASAISTGVVDFVLPVEKMAGTIIDYAGHPYIKEPSRPAHIEKKWAENLEKAFLLIRSVTGKDFSNYKVNTIRRRIERRMAVHKIEYIDDYTRYLEENPKEVESLYKELLISVTSFFRDPAAFDTLKKSVVPGILKSKPAGASVRVWVAGCATGEEAYSIAMVFAEVMKKLKKSFPLTIFATDIDPKAIAFARAARYPENIAADISKERLKRFFVKDGDHYRIRKEIRDSVVFAEQDLVKDPPFTRLDLVSCRNVLIYMNVTLQKKLMPLFYYTLNPKGVLLLSPSETIGSFSDLFTPISLKWKTFRKKGAFLGMPVGEGPAPYAFPVTKAAERSFPTPARSLVKRPDIREAAQKLILESYSPPCVLIDENYDILYLYGRTDKYLSPPAGEPSFNILKMLREDLRSHAIIALHKAVKSKKQVTTGGIEVTRDGSASTVRLTVSLMGEGDGPGGNLLMVKFEETGQGEEGPSAGKRKMAAKTAKAGNPKVQALEHELRLTREFCNTLVEERETANEEFKSANEELQSTNEELQSTNEELETSKEELQSTNEELATVNAELHDKLDELSAINDDLNNLLAATNIATVFLDNSLCIKRFTPAATGVFNLRPQDAGRPISDITTSVAVTGEFPAQSISGEADNVLKTLVPKEAEFETADGKWYSMRILPYRTTENVISGVVMTFVDISRLKLAEQTAFDLKTYAESVIDTIVEPLIILDKDLRVVSANRSFYRTFKAAENGTAGKRIYDIGESEWDIPELRRLLEEIIPRDAKLEGFRISYDFPSIGKKTFILNARRIEETGTRPSYILVALNEANEAAGE